MLSTEYLGYEVSWPHRRQLLSFVTTVAFGNSPTGYGSCLKMMLYPGRKRPVIYTLRIRK